MLKEAEIQHMRKIAMEKPADKEMPFEAGIFAELCCHALVGRYVIRHGYLKDIKMPKKQGMTRVLDIADQVVRKTFLEKDDGDHTENAG